MHLANVIGVKGCTQLVLKAIAYGLIGLHGLLLSSSGYALKVSQHSLDFTRAQHIALHRPPLPLQLAGKQLAIAP